MPDIFSKAKRSEVMSKIRGKNTKPELALCRLLSSKLYPLGFRYRRNYRKVPGSPDVAFVSLKVAVFVDGGFWHGYGAKKRKLPEGYWTEKIRKNVLRDRRVNRKLKALGWAVIRCWDHDLAKRPEKVMERICAALGAE
ncbi:MAG TPA: very short patch repair endonuclease [Candidatus Paceibacterota bacterium]|nr:very short patch repair endonuclease [Candidatus Paceibacterota bacterium]